MRYLALLAGAAALGLISPALAKPGNGHGNGHAQGHWDEGGPPGDGMGGCPPGLFKKGCMPPGQARKLERGQRFESGFAPPYSYHHIPSDVRRDYGLSPRYRYYYRSGTLYVVDPRTMLIAKVIGALLR